MEPILPNTWPLTLTTSNQSEAKYSYHMQPATSMAPLFRSAAFSQTPCLGLDELLEKAAALHTEPFTFALPDGDAFAAAIAVSDGADPIGLWLSELMFSSEESALDHAHDLLGSEIFPLFSCGEDIYGSQNY
jgi:hypothetical protein